MLKFFVNFRVYIRFIRVLNAKNGTSPALPRTNSISNPQKEKHDWNWCWGFLLSIIARFSG